MLSLAYSKVELRRVDTIRFDRADSSDPSIEWLFITRSNFTYHFIYVCLKWPVWKRREWDGSGHTLTNHEKMISYRFNVLKQYLQSKVSRDLVSFFWSCRTKNRSFVSYRHPDGFHWRKAALRLVSSTQDNFPLSCELSVGTNGCYTEETFLSFPVLREVFLSGIQPLRNWFFRFESAWHE